MEPRKSRTFNLRITGTEDAASPFFSPDSRWVAFFAGRKLKKVSVEGGTPVVLCDAPDPRGGSRGEDGNILAAGTKLAHFEIVHPIGAGGRGRFTKPAI